MRPDMAKVIVERPRHSGGRAAKGYARRVRSRESAYDLPTCEGMKRPYAYDGKELNENLAPLYRYLDRQVGRPWNKVYAEMCAHINPRSAVQLHILQHVRQHVAVHAVEQDRKIGSLGYGGFTELWNGHLYVHSRTGLLRRYSARRHPAPPAATTHLAIDATHEYRQHNAVWYWVELTPIDPAHWWSERVSFVDVVVGVRTARQLYDRYERRHLYASGKRQLSKKAIREMKRRYPVVRGKSRSR